MSRWDSLPPLTSVNRLGTLRPGATTLLAGRVGCRAMTAPARHCSPSSATGAEWGSCSACRTAGSGACTRASRVEDATHATLWRQMLRWMVEGVPDQVEIAAVPARVTPGEPVELRARVVDSTFTPVSAGHRRRAGDDTRPARSSTCRWSGRRRRTARTRAATCRPTAARTRSPPRRVRAATRCAPSSGALLADDQGADVEQAELRTALLRQVSNETGGKYYPLSQAGAARGRRELHGERRHSTGCTRSVGHADRLSAARDAAGRRMGLSTPPGARMMSAHHGGTPCARRVAARTRRAARAARAARCRRAARARARGHGTVGRAGVPPRRSSRRRRRSWTARARAWQRLGLEPLRARRGHARASGCVRAGRATQRRDLAGVRGAVAPRRARRRRAGVPRRPWLRRGDRLARQPARAPTPRPRDFAGVARRILAADGGVRERRRAAAATSRRALEAPRRVVVTATRTALERNETPLRHAVRARSHERTRRTPTRTAASRCSRRSPTRSRKSRACTRRTSKLLTEHAAISDSSLARSVSVRRARVRDGGPARAGARRASGRSWRRRWPRCAAGRTR